MAVTAQTIANTLAMRAELERYVIEAELKLARMWGVAWREVSDEYALAVADLVDMAEGDWPTRAQVLRAQRVENALKVTLEQMRDLVPASATAMQDNLASILASADHWSQRIVRTQLPQGVSQTWNRVDMNAMDAIVKRATTRIHALTMPLSRDMVSRMKAVLIRGVVVGENPKAAARQILGRCDQAFAGGRARALNIARTEMVDAHRASALQSRKANRDVVGGWRWHTTLSNRTCPSCLSQHGSLHPADELGPLDHQQGRCTSVPVTKSWKELGFDMEEPPDAFPNAREWFQAQSKDVRQRIMGVERLKQLESGTLKWGDLSVRRSAPGWRDSYNVRPLSKPLNLQPEPEFVDKIAAALRVDRTTGTEKHLQSLLTDDATQPLTKANIRAAFDRIGAERAAAQPLRFETAQGARDWANKVWAGPSGYPDDELAALRGYTAADYGPMNNVLRSSKGKRSNPKTRAMDRAMDRAARVPNDITVIRNANLRQLGITTSKGDPRNLVGAEFVDHGYLSTSINRTGAMQGEVRLSINVPKGSRGVYVSGDGGRKGPGIISDYGGGESELILDRGSRLVIRSVRKVGSRWHVDADLLQGLN